MDPLADVLDRLARLVHRVSAGTTAEIALSSVGDAFRIAVGLAMIASGTTSYGR